MNECCQGCGAPYRCDCWVEGFDDDPECRECGDTHEVLGRPCPSCHGDDGGEPCDECEARFATHTCHGRRLCDGCGRIESRIGPFAMECPW